jgi:hypothetical protein
MIKLLLRISLLYVLFLVSFVVGSLAVASVLPDGAQSEPGLVPPGAGLLIIALVNVAVVAALILTSRWSGWKLALGLALVYYGVVTVLPQIETWYFLSSLTVDRELLPRLFVMGIPPALFFVPLAVLILGKWRDERNPPDTRVEMSMAQWAGKLAALAVVYVVLYWSAGYFIAWQNPELRAFYRQPGEPLPFFTHTADVLRSDPGLFAFQFLRGILWVLCALPVIRGSRLSTWRTALLVGLLFSAPQNIGQILANPLMPIASVRLSHMVETAASTFVFGVVVVWMLHRRHDRISRAGI